LYEKGCIISWKQIGYCPEANISTNFIIKNKNIKLEEMHDIYGKNLSCSPYITKEYIEKNINDINFVLLSKNRYIK
jgi:hypothetical protein